MASVRSICIIVTLLSSNFPGASRGWVFTRCVAPCAPTEPGTDRTFDIPRPLCSATHSSRYRIATVERFIICITARCNSYPASFFRNANRIVMNKDQRGGETRARIHYVIRLYVNRDLGKMVKDLIKLKARNVACMLQAYWNY